MTTLFCYTCENVLPKGRFLVTENVNNTLLKECKRCYLKNKEQQKRIKRNRENNHALGENFLLLSEIERIADQYNFVPYLKIEKIPQLNQCTCCHEWKESKDFYRRYYGLTTQCINCIKIKKEAKKNQPFKFLNRSNIG